MSYLDNFSSIISFDFMFNDTRLGHYSQIRTIYCSMFSLCFQSVTCRIAKPVLGSHMSCSSGRYNGYFILRRQNPHVSIKQCAYCSRYISMYCGCFLQTLVYGHCLLLRPYPSYYFSLCIS